MTQFKDAPIFDADQHMYETPDALTRYLPKEFLPKVQFVQIGRHTRIAILNKITDYMPNPTFERVAAPGAHEKFYSGQNPEGLSMREMSGRGIDTPPGARNPEDRIAELDRQGVDACLNYPTLANLVEHSAAEDPDLTVAIIHALNQWMLEHWGFSHANRVYSTPVLNLGIVDEARRELAYILENGAKVALIKPAPVNGYKGWRSPALPEFDPFWRDVEDAGLPIVLHASQPPLQEYIDKWEPPSTSSAFEMSAFKWTALGHREIADMLTSLICHGTLDPVPEAAHRQRGERQRVDQAAVRRPAVDVQQDAAELPRASTRGVPPQHLGQPVLGRLGCGCGADGRVGQGDVRLGLATSRRPGRAQAVLAVRRGHGHSAHLRLHGRQRPPLHGPAAGQPRPGGNQAARNGERLSALWRLPTAGADHDDGHRHRLGAAVMPAVPGAVLNVDVAGA